jgi:hypothetical protein
LTSLTSWLAGQADPVEAAAKFRRFGDLIQATPSLRAYQRDMTDQLAADAAQVLARRIATDADDPEPQIAARAPLELWRVQDRSLRRYLATTSTPAQIHNLVASDVRRAARILSDGLASIDTLNRRAGGPAQARGRPARSVHAESSLPSTTSVARPLH